MNPGTLKLDIGDDFDAVPAMRSHSLADSEALFLQYAAKTATHALDSFSNAVFNDPVRFVKRTLDVKCDPASCVR
jgi:hypothetical protein